MLASQKMFITQVPVTAAKLGKVITLLEPTALQPKIYSPTPLTSAGKIV